MDTIITIRGFLFVCLVIRRPKVTNKIMNVSTVDDLPPWERDRKRANTAV